LQYQECAFRTIRDKRKKEINKPPSNSTSWLVVLLLQIQLLTVSKSAIRAIGDKRKEESTVYLHFWACDVAVVAESVAYSVKKGQYRRYETNNRKQALYIFNPGLVVLLLQGHWLTVPRKCNESHTRQTEESKYHPSPVQGFLLLLCQVLVILTECV
jgi:hypothetical protein